MDDPVLAAVLSALAGARRDDRVAVVGAGELVARALLAASATDALVDNDARVVVAGAAYDVPTALRSSRRGAGWSRSRLTRPRRPGWRQPAAWSCATSYPSTVVSPGRPCDPPSRRLAA